MTINIQWTNKPNQDATYLTNITRSRKHGSVICLYTPQRLDNALNIGTQHLNEQTNVLLEYTSGTGFAEKSLRMSYKLHSLKKAFKHADQVFPRLIQICRKQEVSFRKSDLSERTELQILRSEVSKVKSGQTYLY